MSKQTLQRLRFFLFLALFGGYFSGCALLIRFPSSSSKGDRSDLRPVPFASKAGESTLFRGVFHLHTKFSHDSKISLKQVVKEAQKAQLDFAVITDHNTLAGKEFYRNGSFPSYPLLIFGTEISTPDGHLIALGLDEMPVAGKSSEELIQWIQNHGGYSIFSHPESSKNPWDRPELPGTSGLEVYNFAHSFYDANKFRLAGQIFLLPKPFLKSFQKRAPFSLKLWDKKLTEGRYAAFGAADAHIHWKIFGLSPESYFLQLRAVTMYVFAGELEEEKIVEALGTGKSFIAFEVFGSAKGFSFTASTTIPGTGISGPGDTFTSTGSFVLSVQTPREANIRLIHRGKLLKEGAGTALEYSGTEAGPYRVEVYQGKNLWIISNPIYVET